MQGQLVGSLEAAWRQRRQRWQAILSRVEMIEPLSATDEVLLIAGLEASVGACGGASAKLGDAAAMLKLSPTSRLTFR